MNHSSLGSNKEFNFGTDEKHISPLRNIELRPRTTTIDLSS
ncbi:hypothetical protein AALP_AA8G020800, partial [Arabis alpina]